MIRDLQVVRPQTSRTRIKLCLAGPFAVGKTSLIRRFAHEDYTERYIATWGTHVTSKELDVRVGREQTEVPVLLNLWDIMGSKGLRDLRRETYFRGVQGILAVCDATRPETLPVLEGWRQSIFRVAGNVPTYVLANKADQERAITREELNTFCEEWGCPFLYTSAKTGESVEEAFAGLTRVVLRYLRP
ncbi:MAG: Rab family GTPase [Thermoplasmata archaeon]